MLGVVLVPVPLTSLGLASARLADVRIPLSGGGENDFVLSLEASSSGPGVFKRPRSSCSDESSGDLPDLVGGAPKRLRRSCVQRPGVPLQCNLATCRFPGKLSPAPREDDKDGHYVYDLGENLSSRYKILGKMGEGTFGRVLECWDRQRKDYVAIKIVRNIDKYRHAAMIELEVLNTLEQNDPQGENHCVALREWFDYRGHVCMVFEKLGLSLFDFMRKNNYRPFTLNLVQSFCRQLLEAVAYMHELRLVHTDLKPENILLVESQSTRPGHMPATSEIKVIDFGSATFEEQYHSCIVSTRHYRAPEVILGLGWSYPCDMWSVGCILIELLTGEALFQTHENLEHLAMMEAVLGPLPTSMAAKCARTQSGKYFTNAGRLNWPDGAANRKSVKAVKRLTSLTRLLSEQGEPSSRSCEAELYDLISSMLQYEPSDRVTAPEALQHPFLSRALPAPPASRGASQAPSVNTGGTAAMLALGLGLPGDATVGTTPVVLTEVS